MNINSVGLCKCCNAKHGSEVKINLMYMQDVQKWIIEVYGTVNSHGACVVWHSVVYFNNTQDAMRHFDIEVNSHKQHTTPDQVYKLIKQTKAYQQRYALLCLMEQ